MPTVCNFCNGQIKILLSGCWSSFLAAWDEVKTVKISNISLSASQRDIQEFFCFSGDIDYVEMQSDSENSQLACVTFRDSQGAETAMPLRGATIVDRSVSVTPVEKYKLPPGAYGHKLDRVPSPTNAAVKKALCSQ
ncbi:hypothetical protein MUK42_37708 [Musa troglodytarum]|uniref:RRM domain-containing protein n=1 Tax=Musa troglodytarum TaxID=320322 RepID=A0A9E7FL08_9LILI|nr:hypothetical protein MUK42_37708 [Musa troglodytarum]